MNKKAVVITTNGVITDVIEVKTFVTPEEYLSFVKKAKENKAKLEQERLETESAYKKSVDDQFGEIIKGFNFLSLEVDLLRGKITEEEYEERKQELLCGTK